METNALIKALQIGGLPALVIIGLFFICRAIIRKNIFPRLTTKQTYFVIILIILSFSSITVICVFKFSPSVNFSNRKTIVYQIKAIDSKTKEGIAGVIAYIIKNSGDSIKSHPSGDDGKIVLQFDTLDNIVVAIHYFHPLYLSNSRNRDLPMKMADEDIILNAIPPISPKFFYTIGLNLNKDEILQIERATTYIYSHDKEGVKFEITFDKSGLLQFDTEHKKDLWKFTGGVLELVKNGVVYELNPWIIKSESSAPIHKQNLINQLNQECQLLANKHKKDLILKIITCLNT